MAGTEYSERVVTENALLEIQALFEKWDLAGMVVLQGKQFVRYAQFLHPSWSAIETRKLDDNVSIVLIEADPRKWAVTEGMLQVFWNVTDDWSQGFEVMMAKLKTLREKHGDGQKADESGGEGTDG